MTAADNHRAARQAVQREIDRAQVFRPEAPPPPDGVLLARGDTLTPEPVRWLWPSWLALGKLAILAGAPGTGKTTIALAVAATVTTGTHYPDGTRAPLGDVLVWSGEDDAADTLLPRLLAAGADKSRVYFIGNVRAAGEVRPFDPATDMPALLLAAKKLPALRLILVDPVVSAVAGDSHKNTEVRRGLQPLVDFASEAGAALLGITHFSKGGQGSDPASRVVGSIAFTAVARVVLVAAKVKDDDGERRILARSKSNLGPDDGGFAYTLEPCEPLPGIFTTRCVFGEAVAGSARDLLAEPEPEASASRGRQSEAVEFLREALATGSTPVGTLKTEAEEAGFTWKTIRTASEKLGVKKRKGGYQGEWYWSLAGTEDAPKVPKEAKDASQKDVGILGTFGESMGTFDDAVIKREVPAP